MLVAVAVPFVESVVGALLVAQFERRAVALVAAGLLVGFTILLVLRSCPGSPPAVRVLRCAVDATNRVAQRRAQRGVARPGQRSWWDGRADQTTLTRKVSTRASSCHRS